MLALVWSEDISTKTVPRFSSVAPRRSTRTMSLSRSTSVWGISLKAAIISCRSVTPGAGNGRLRTAKLRGVAKSSGFPILASRRDNLWVFFLESWVLHDLYPTVVLRLLRMLHQGFAGDSQSYNPWTSPSFKFCNQLVKKIKA